MLQTLDRINNIISTLNSESGASDIDLTSAIKSRVLTSDQAALDRLYTDQYTKLVLDTPLLPAYALYNRKNLKVVDLSKCTSIGDQCFRSSSSLNTVIIRTPDTICTLGTQALRYTQIESGKGKIYVPDALVNDYKNASNWTALSDCIYTLSEYTEA